MKSGIYNAIAGFNRSFDVAQESLAILEQEGVITADYLQEQTEKAEEFRVGVNRLLHNKLGTREQADEEYYSKMRQNSEKRREGEQTIGGLPPESRRN